MERQICRVFQNNDIGDITSMVFVEILYIGSNIQHYCYGKDPPKVDSCKIRHGAVVVIEIFQPFKRRRISFGFNYEQYL